MSIFTKQRAFLSKPDAYSFLPIDNPTSEKTQEPLNEDAFTPNFLEIDAISPPFLQTVYKYNQACKSLIIETGNLIYTALKEAGLDSIHFDHKIIILASSKYSAIDIQLIFEKYTFKTSFYPIVEEHRTEYGDLLIHLSDEPPLRITPYKLPSKGIVHLYLNESEFVKDSVSPRTIKTIAKTLANKDYIPYDPQHPTPSLVNDKIQLQPCQINAINSALVRCSKRFPIISGSNVKKYSLTHHHLCYHQKLYENHPYVSAMTINESKRRAFLSNPLKDTFTPSLKNDVNEAISITNDYRTEIQKIKTQIFKSNMDNLTLFNKQEKAYRAINGYD